MWFLEPWLKTRYQRTALDDFVMGAEGLVVLVLVAVLWVAVTSLVDVLKRKAK